MSEHPPSTPATAASTSASSAAGLTPQALQLQMLQTMATMQAEHNQQVHPQWETQGYDYYRAIWVECAELLDHYGWKWWKHQTPDIGQSRLELVDIWHFGLSELIRDQVPLAEILAGFAPLAEGAGGADAAEFRAAVEALAGKTLVTKSFPQREFVAALATLPMSYQELFELYIGKNVLNRFRQSNGYKDGTYRKEWNGREDNEHLIEVLAEVPISSADYVGALFAALQQRYSAAASMGD